MTDKINKSQIFKSGALDKDDNIITKELLIKQISFIQKKIKEFELNLSNYNNYTKVYIKQNKFIKIRIDIEYNEEDKDLNFLSVVCSITKLNEEELTTDEIKYTKRFGFGFVNASELEYYEMYSIHKETKEIKMYCC
jgi:hypothetical protein